MQGLIVLGTASDVGKSLICTAICRAFANEGIRVAPFKSQNMSNNSYITADGKEIGRAQGIQAEAAKTEASAAMNPILLKPRSAQHSEIVLFGKVLKTLSGRGYRESFYERGKQAIQLALEELEKAYDLVVMEGAGSPVEINLKDRELVNMQVAKMADVPAVLVADIDRGGVFASIVGTLELLTEEERKRVKGLIINKFRGDPALFLDGIEWIEKRTGVPVLGVLPYLEEHMIDGEDSLSISQSAGKIDNKSLDIAVIQLPYISNYSDVEPFYFEKDVVVRFVHQVEEIGNPDGVILPGTKSTIEDLRYLKKKGFAQWLKNYAEEGGYIAGICGGYQMMGEKLFDPSGTDTGMAADSETGLGIISASTVFLSEKTTVRAVGVLHPSTCIGEALQLEGYEIHLGQTELSGSAEKHPFLLLDNGETDGVYLDGGRIIGTYMHHLFHNDSWRNRWLNMLRERKGLSVMDVVPLQKMKNAKYDELAVHFTEHIDWEKLKTIIFQWRNTNELD